MEQHHFRRQYATWGCSNILARIIHRGDDGQAGRTIRESMKAEDGQKTDCHFEKSGIHSAPLFPIFPNPPSFYCIEIEFSQTGDCWIW